MIDWLGSRCSKLVPVNDETIEVATLQGFECIIKIILNIAVNLAGIAVLVMLIVGGFKYLTSGGDPKAVESARKTLTAAIAGLALLIFSWFILRLIKEFTGIDVTVFEIPSPNP